MNERDTEAAMQSGCFLEGIHPPHISTILARIDAQGIRVLTGIPARTTERAISVEFASHCPESNGDSPNAIG
jgi:hypothetical protein